MGKTDTSSLFNDFSLLQIFVKIKEQQNFYHLPIQCSTPIESVFASYLKVRMKVLPPPLTRLEILH